MPRLFTWPIYGVAMIATHIEVERTYELAPGVALPELTGVAGVVEARALADERLDATYYDTADLTLARARTTLRRRSGGRDAGWHLKLPVGGDTREEVQLPPRGRGTAVPKELSALVRARVRRDRLEPVVRLRTSRQVLQLLDADARVLAEVADDAVTGDVLGDPLQTVVWREVEIELVDGDDALLDAVGERLEAAGAVRAARPSKLARTLGGRLPAVQPRAEPERPDAGRVLLQHLQEQVDELVARDPAVRRDLPDSVHKMRVATRRLRSALKTFRPLLDREATDRLRDELAHLAGVLGEARDAEVLRDRLRAAVDALPPEQVLGPVAKRIDDTLGSRYRTGHEHVVAELDGARHLALLDDLDRLLTEPPLTELAARPARSELKRLVRRTWKRLADTVAAADAAATPEQREELLHDVRKTAKQVRYAGEAVAPVLGADAKRLARHATAVQEVLGEHQDSVVTREGLRELGVVAHLAGENGFTFGLLHGLEAAHASVAEDRFAAAWKQASRPAALRWLR